MKITIEETKRRRRIQQQYNEEHGITPKTIIKNITPPIHMIDDENAKRSKKQDQGKMTTKQIQLMIKNLTSEMNRAAKALDFEEAAQLRDQILELKAQL
jgi:excinuclease ABC subunit B